MASHCAVLVVSLVSKPDLSHQVIETFPQKFAVTACALIPTYFEYTVLLSSLWS